MPSNVIDLRPDALVDLLEEALSYARAGALSAVAVVMVRDRSHRAVYRGSKDSTSFATMHYEVLRMGGDMHLTANMYEALAAEESDGSDDDG